MTPTTAAVDPDKRTPGRPRSARAEQAIIDAVLDLIAEDVAIEALSIESVAAKAGVGKATIYRRWSSKEDLIVDAAASLKLPVPDLVGEDVRDDLIALLTSMGPSESATKRNHVFTCLSAQVQRSPELQVWYRKVIEPRRERVREVLRRGIAEGMLRPDLDVEVTLTVLSAPMTGRPIGGLQTQIDRGELAERVVDAVLDGARRR
ncbi:TetR family transcriptional regulator [Virgisporangium aliadipatigenens]|uniref:TetR family transcriptional regulator n=1 Tax=Virgisporangium aliadipatigenens TaxID=741659 RepID=A0A8J3YNT4_9ACTN|nr:TetR/AcrR family transcriptional regulator [Virgisporangium aliadipatigenens]GIJ47752.1 TetR family transcriptional regulator [Virgisporangium aliadipatigenens]